MFTPRRCFAILEKAAEKAAEKIVEKAVDQTDAVGKIGSTIRKGVEKVIPAIGGRRNGDSSESTRNETGSEGQAMGARSNIDTTESTGKEREAEGWHEKTGPSYPDTPPGITTKSDVDVKKGEKITEDAKSEDTWSGSVRAYVKRVPEMAKSALEGRKHSIFSEAAYS